MKDLNKPKSLAQYILAGYRGSGRGFPIPGRNREAGYTAISGQTRSGIEPRPSCEPEPSGLIRDQA